MADSAAQVPVKVCGHMGAVLSESDSSSDESCQDDVEVEFGEESADSSRSSNEVFDSITQPPAAVERNGIMMADLPPTSNGNNARFALGTKAPAIVADRAMMERQPVDNAFGIAYKPCGTSSKQGYELLAGPAFADEDEFEQEMGEEFRVVLGSSGSLEPPTCMSSGMAQSKNVSSKTGVGIDDSSDDEGSDCRAEEQKGVTDCELEASGSFPSSTPSSSEPCIPDSNSSQPPANDVVAPLYPSGLKLDNQEALKSLTEEYNRTGLASQNSDQLDLSAEKVGGRHKESGTAAVAGIPAHLGGDVRQYPVMEEEGEEQEEEEESIQVVDNLEKAATPEVEGRGEEEHGAINNDSEDDDSKRARVTREWEAIDQLRTAENSVPMEKGVGGALQPIRIDQDNCIVTTKEVLRYFHSQDLAVYKKDIIPFQPPESRFGLLRRAPKLKFPDGEQLRDEVFLFAQIKYSPDDVVHRRLIQTIYRRMTNEKRSCPNVGPHWDVIGFQGNDPRTDLNRSMGLFALFQVLSLLETQLAFAMVLHRLSLADVTGWPFLCVSIGFTKEAVGVLRRGSCYSECNRRESVLEVVDEIHQAQFYGFLELCRKKPATHHALHLAKVRTRMDTDSRGLVKAYRTYLSEEKARSALGIVEKTGGSAAGRELVDFPAGENAEEPRMKLGIAANRKSKYVTDG